MRPIGIDRSRFAPGSVPVAQRRPMVLFLGRLVEKKGCTYLLEAFERVRARLPQAELIIGGDGPERTKLADRKRPRSAAHASSAPSPGTWPGSLLAEARVFCLPSVTAESGDAEGLPLVVLEAQASGVPVVTSARGGATEGIQGRGDGLRLRGSATWRLSPSG